MSANLTTCYRALLIEDDPRQVRHVRQAVGSFSPQSLDLSCARHFEDALAILESTQVDVILLDATLPGMMHIDALSHLKQRCREIPIITLNDGNDLSMAVEALQAGAQDCLTKASLNGERLVTSIRYAIERQQQHEKLRQLAIVDPLTGLYNRRGLDALGKQQMRMARRTGKAMIMFFCDLDGLKQINDHFGHEEGDRAIQALARILEATFRSSDILARIGGDEFVAIAIDAEPSMANTIRRRLLRQRQGEPLMLRQPVGFSVGSSVYDPTSNLTLQQWLDRADRQMYRHKRRRKETPAA
jgi:diguanylate cyclase (GGDEF)-like protein